MQRLTNPLAASVREQTLGQMLRRSAGRFKDKLAIVCGNVSWTYREFDRVVDDISNGLLNSGLLRGDRVAILSRNSHFYAAIRFAVARAGLVLVPINTMLNDREISYILRHSGARWLFADNQNAEKALGSASMQTAVEQIVGLDGEDGTTRDSVVSLDSILSTSEMLRSEEPPAAGDIAQIIYTSGTESLPKGVLLSHEAILWQYQSCIYELELQEQDVFLHAMPMFHCAQLDTFLGPCIAVGATNIIIASPTPNVVLPSLLRHAATSFFAPPTVWITLMQAGGLSEMTGVFRKAYYGASIMPMEILRQLRDTLPAIRFWNCYGQSEMAPLATVLHPEEHDGRPGSVGRSVINVETRLIDDNGSDVEVGEIGEIVHRSPQAMHGYLNDAGKTAEAFDGGWFHSGDLARCDEEGYYWIVDRKKDMIKTGGENVASSEVENALLAHPGVGEVAVVGMPHPKWIEAITAIVIIRPGFTVTAEELSQHCSARLAGFKTPKAILFADALPKNASGKVVKRDLKLWAAERELATSNR